MDPAPYIPLVDFAEAWQAREVGATAPFAVSDRPPASLPAPVQDRLEEVVDTVTALQRAEWLEDGLYVGPRALPRVYRAVLDASRQLEVAVPPSIVTKIPSDAQGTHGTDGRAFLLLAGGFVKSARDAELAFVVGRLVGHLAAGQVTARSVYKLLADHNGGAQARPPRPGAHARGGARPPVHGGAPAAVPLAPGGRGDRRSGRSAGGR